MYPDPNQNQPGYPQGNPPQPSAPPQPPYPQAPSQYQQAPSGQPQQQYSIDYLNQIAPKTQKPGMSNKLFLALIGGVVLIVIVFALSLFNGGGGPKDQMQHLAARLEGLQKITDDAQKNIKSNDLRSTNSNLSIFLTNANRDIADPLLKNGVDIKKLDKNIVAAEKGDDLSAKLEDARLNAVFDRTYSREMTYELTTVETLMESIYNGTKSKSLKTYLQDTENNLSPIKKQFEDFSATSS